MAEESVKGCVGRRFAREERGTVLVELAISLLIILTILFATLELCGAVYTYTVLANAANEGVRYAIVHSSDSTGAADRVRTYAAYSMHDVSAMVVSVTYPDGSATPPNRVAVSVSYQYVPYLGNFMANPPTMAAYSEGRLVY
jgi:Flp pilus assembly protein TadG